MNVLAAPVDGPIPEVSEYRFAGDLWPGAPFCIFVLHLG